MIKEEKIVFTTGIDIIKNFIDELENELLYTISQFEKNPSQEMSFYITALTKVLLKMKYKLKEINEKP